MPDSALPTHLRGTLHWDWPWPLSKVPRGWTSFKWGVPVMSYGNQMETRAGVDLDGAVRFGPAPIGEKGSWQVSEFPWAPWGSLLIPFATWLAAVYLPGWWKLMIILALPFQPFYFAMTTRRGRHFRLGARWDNVDNYVTVPTIATRIFTGKDDQDTSTR